MALRSRLGYNMVTNIRRHYTPVLGKRGQTIKDKEVRVSSCESLRWSAEGFVVNIGAFACDVLSIKT